MIKKEFLYIDTSNSLLKKFLNNEISFFYCFLIIFFAFLPFTNFSIAGDIESILKCRLISLEEQILLNDDRDLNCIMRNHFYLIDKLVLFVTLISKNVKSFINLEIESKYSLQLYYELIISLFFYSFFLINLILLIKLSDRKITLANVFIGIIFLFTCYLGNFLAFFHQEILIGTLFIIKIINFKKNQNENKKLYINFVVDLLISIFKIYYLIPVFFLNFYLLNSYKKFFIYNIFLFVTSVSIYYLNNYQEFQMHLNETYKFDFSLKLYFQELFYIFLSPAIGFFVTMPIFILFYFVKKNFLFKLKLLATISLMFFLSLFFFWHGSGSSGCRYLFPLLLLFYEEFKYIFSKFINLKKFKILLVFLFVGFYQSLNYHSPVLLFGYKDSKFNENFKVLDQERTIGTLSLSERFPKSNYKLSPVIFGWNIEIKKLFEINEMEILINKEKRYINPLEIIPNTNLSRAYYLSQHNRISSIEDKRLELLKFKDHFKLTNSNYIFLLFFIFFVFSYIVFSFKKTNQKF